MNKKYLVLGLGLLMILLMIGSAFFSFEGEEEGFNYNGYYFYKTGNIWNTNYNGQVMQLEYNPRDVENIQNFQVLNGKAVYFFYESENDAINFLKTVFQFGGFTFVPEKIEDCKTETSVNLIYVEYNEEIKEPIISKRDNCILLSGDSYSLKKIAYYYLYKFMGIF
ncbi:hypothetical protein J4436_00575 [Candidatus Woesearchaeota archaeon]|nr:hypothetical protein [Candidatus Woesearchaeota archaeon]